MNMFVYFFPQGKACRKSDTLHKIDRTLRKNGGGGLHEFGVQGSGQGVRAPLQGGCMGDDGEMLPSMRDWKVKDEAILWSDASTIDGSCGVSLGDTGLGDTQVWVSPAPLLAGDIQLRGIFDSSQDGRKLSSSQSCQSYYSLTALSFVF